MKRLIDITISVTAMAVLSPLLLVIALLIRWKMGRPVIFGQVRPLKDHYSL